MWALGGGMVGVRNIFVIMKKEILLYGAIYSWSAEYFVQQMEAHADKSITLRINTPGGEVNATYGMMAKWQEHKGSKIIKVDGQAASAGAFICCYATDVEALDVSTFLFHRAAYPSYIENNKNYFTDAMRASLVDTNKHLRAAMESKFSATEWEVVTGVSMDQLFSLDDRIDVVINAEQAKRLGLITKITKITPEQKEAIAARIADQNLVIAAHMGISTPHIDPIKDPKAGADIISFQHQNNKKMTIEKLKAEHPEIYAQVVGLGITQERDRVGAYMAFAHLDLEGVRGAIKDGTVMNETERSEYALKAYSAEALHQMQQHGVPPVTEVPVQEGQNTPPAPAEQQATAFFDEVYANLGVTKK